MVSNAAQSDPPISPSGDPSAAATPAAAAAACPSWRIPPCPLSAPEAALLSLFLELNLNLESLATRTGLPLLDLLAWTDSAPIRSQLDALARLRQESEGIALAAARLTAIHTLAEIAAEPSNDPIERRRAASILLRRSCPSPFAGGVEGGGGRSASGGEAGGGRLPNATGGLSGDRVATPASTPPSPPGRGAAASAAERAPSPAPPAQPTRFRATDPGVNSAAASSPLRSSPAHPLTPSPAQSSPSSLASEILELLRSLPQGARPTAAADALSRAALLAPEIRGNYIARARFVSRLAQSRILEVPAHPRLEAPQVFTDARGRDRATITATFTDDFGCDRPRTLHFTRAPTTEGPGPWRLADIYTS